MRRRPQEDDEEQHEAFEVDRPVDRRPADHRREGAGGAADDDVLRRPALQPHRVDDDVEEDGEGEQRRRQPVGREAEQQHRERRRAISPKASASSGWMRPARDRPVRGAAITASMSASYHMLSAPAAPAPTAMHRIAMKPSTGWMPPGASEQADERGEDDQRHHPRLEQREIVARSTPTRRRRRLVRHSAVDDQAICLPWIEAAQPRSVGRGVGAAT